MLDLAVRVRADHGLNPETPASDSTPETSTFEKGRVEMTDAVQSAKTDTPNVLPISGTAVNVQSSNVIKSHNQKNQKVKAAMMKKFFANAEKMNIDALYDTDDDDDEKSYNPDLQSTNDVIMPKDLTETTKTKNDKLFDNHDDSDVFCGRPLKKKRLNKRKDLYFVSIEDEQKSNEYTDDALKNRPDLQIVSMENTAGHLEYVYVNDDQIDILKTMEAGKTNEFVINDKRYLYYRTDFNDHNCMYHSLMFVLTHWDDLTEQQYLNHKEIRKLICDEMEHLIDDDWFIKLMDIYADIEYNGHKGRKKYIEKMRKNNTWGSRIELMIFCKLYQCEIFVAHSTEGKRFKLDSTLLAIHNVHNQNSVQVIKERIGYIASVNVSDIFSLNANINRNHLIFLKESDKEMTFSNISTTQSRIDVINRLLLNVDYQGKEALLRALEKCTKKRYLPITPEVTTKRRKKTTVVVLDKSTAKTSMYENYYNIDKLVFKGKQLKYLKIVDDTNKNSLFNSLVFALLFWSDCDKANHKKLRKKICDKMTEVVDQKWFMDLIRLYHGIDSPLKRSEYIRNLRSNKCSESILELIIFCIIYDCNVYVCKPDADKPSTYYSVHDLTETKNIFKNSNTSRVCYLASMPCVDTKSSLVAEETCFFIYLQELSAKIVLTSEITIRKKRYFINKLLKDVLYGGKNMLEDLLSSCTRKRKSINQNKNVKKKYDLKHSTEKSKRKKELYKMHAEKPGFLQKRADDQKENRQKNSIKGIWMALEGSLHEKKPIACEMKLFEDEMRRLRPTLLKPCKICHRLWYDRKVERTIDDEMCEECFTDIGSFCERSYNDISCVDRSINNHTKCCCRAFKSEFSKNYPKLFSVFNDMYPGKVPPALKCINELEELLIALVCPVMKVYRKTKRYNAYTGNVINLPQQTEDFAAELPRSISDLPIIWMLREGKNETFRFVHVRRARIKNALHWLKKHNPLYQHFKFSQKNLDALPEDGEINYADLDTIIIPAEGDDEAKREEQLASVCSDNEDIECSEPETSAIDACFNYIDHKKVERDENIDENEDFDNIFADVSYENPNDSIAAIGHVPDNLLDDPLADQNIQKSSKVKHSKSSSIVQQKRKNVYSMDILDENDDKENGDDNEYLNISNPDLDQQYDDDYEEMEDESVALGYDSNIILQKKYSDYDLKKMAESMNDTVDNEEVKSLIQCVNDRLKTPFTETINESYIPDISKENVSEIERLKRAIKGCKHDIFNWPKVGKYGLNEYTQSYLAAACFPTLFPYASGDFTTIGRKRNVTIKKARAYYEKFADYNEDGTISYRFAKHHLWSFWIFNMSNRRELNSQTNAFIKNTPSTTRMTREELLAELNKSAQNVIAM